MPKPFRLIKSLFELVLKPNETYPPAKPSKTKAKVEVIAQTPAVVKKPRKSKRTQSVSLGTWDVRRGTDLLMSSPVSRMFPLPTKRPRKNKNGKYDTYIRKIKNYKHA